ncbi:hypothetical protein PC9H_005508 [Pleurotus ostreatus]|uniref:Uncharacterized protein n=1 Tax=Pleurotus ostreatus TaxID=5322 RepID=A0A8H6ZX82_PLEOS|nr:uncharacterized protein PC9H_005508 [Pleurotus ostreatus]KAF7433550.1 hypothetical protein PC9H_005508 [Pleurotus ostreatus]KAJ8697725.1 hypothetical protein PTI98_004501 [Pleurotus ostreatus]
MTVVTRSAAKKKLSGTTPSSPPRRSTNTPKPKARTIARPPPNRARNENPSSTNTGFRTTLIDSSGAVVTVAPSATGQGVHTRWAYDPTPYERTSQDTQMNEETGPTTHSALPSPSSTPPSINARYVTPAPRESFYPSTALCTPQKGVRAKVVRRSPRRVNALAPEVIIGNQRYHHAMEKALNRTNDGESSNLNVLPTPSKQNKRDVFSNRAQTAAAEAPRLGQPVSLQRAPLGRYDTIQWDAGCGETPVASPKTCAESPKRRSPLVRSLDSGPGPLLGPMGTQIIGPNGTHLLLGATAGPILDTQIINENDSMMDITMDEGGHLKGPIGPHGEKLGRDGKQLLGPSGTLLHYDMNRLADKMRDGRVEAKGFLGGSPSRARRLGPSGNALLE